MTPDTTTFEACSDIMPKPAVSSEAEKAKLTGNELFAKGKYNAAIEVKNDALP